MIDQCGNVCRSLAQRRHIDLDDSKPIEKVFAEVPRRHTLRQIAIRGADDADIDGSWPRFTDRLDLAVLEETQQHRLHPQAHLADFIQKQYSAVGKQQLARAIAIRAREATFNVPEQLRFEQFLGDARAVHGQELAAGPIGRAVDLASDDVLADPALARDECLGAEATRPPGELADAPHLAACRDKSLRAR